MKKLVNKIKDTLSIFSSSKGFTLLELLVVILIIGILASIALPQYQNAVRKARVAEAKVILHDLSDAIDRYFLQHGNFEWDSLEDFDIDFPIESNNWNIYIDECAGEGCLVIAVPKWEEGYDIRHAGQRFDGCEAGKFICSPDSTTYNKICEHLGGKEVDYNYQI